jgi:hypothetical protein
VRGPTPTPTEHGREANLPIWEVERVAMTIRELIVFIVLIVFVQLAISAQPEDPETPVTTATEQDLAEDDDAAAMREEHCTPWDC